MKQIVAISVAVALCGILNGCAAPSDSRQAAVQRWEKSAAQAKLPMVENLIERGRTADARKTLQQCLEAEPESAHAHFLMGQINLIEERLDDARVSFAEAISLDASLDPAWYHLGVLYLMENNIKRAMDAYHTALSLKPAETEYVVAVAHLYMQTDRSDLARELLEDRLKRQPRNRELLISIAELERRSGQLEKTVGYYEQILLSNANDSEVLESLAYCYAATKNWTHAGQTFEKLLKVVKEESRKEDILDTLALCMFNAGDYAKALRYYDRLLVQRRDDAELWLKIAQAALGADMIDRAAANANRALQLKPSWPQAYAVLGSAQYLQTNYEAAIRSFSYARRDDEISGYAWFMTGRCYAQLGQTAKAENAYQRAGDLSADSLLIRRFVNDTADAL